MNRVSKKVLSEGTDRANLSIMVIGVLKISEKPQRQVRAGTIKEAFFREPESEGSDG